MKPGIPRATVERLPRYLQCLEQIPRGQGTISSSELARLSGVNAANVRKDLSYLGSHGVRGVGYHIVELAAQIRSELGLAKERQVIVVGIGNLGSALAKYDGFSDRGFRIVGLYDIDPNKIGAQVGPQVIRPIEQLPADAAASDIAMAIITTPTSAAQGIASLLVSAGVRSILNFAPELLDVPDHVHLRQVELATELQILSFYLADSESQTG